MAKLTLGAILVLAMLVTGAVGIRNLTDSKAYSDPRIVPALVIFGDSTVDAGNNNYLATIIKSDFKPYGMSFAGQVPTGRFTDGLLVTDYVSQKLGLPLQLPWLNPAARGEAILTGVNFASSASGWFENTATHFGWFSACKTEMSRILLNPYYQISIENVILDDSHPGWVSKVELVQQNVKGLDAQYEWFGLWKNEVLKTAGPEKGQYIIDNALYAISTGANDWVNNYYLNLNLQNKYTPEKYIDFLVGNLKKYTLELYNLGGRNIIVLGLPPLGCIPSQVTLHGAFGDPGCVKFLNDVSFQQNVKIIQAVEDMNKITPGARILYIDIYNPIKDAYENPAKFGFKYSRDGCCGTGDLEVAVLCNRALVSACDNPSEHLYWDSFHPTSHFYSQLADYMYNLAAPKVKQPPNP